MQESSPLLMSVPENTVQFTRSSLKDYLFCQDAQSVSVFYRFSETDAHARMSNILIPYNSFHSFQSALTEQLQPRYFLLENATKWLVCHSTRRGASTQTSDKLVIFFDTVQGWKWLQRLSDAYGIFFGHRQLLQCGMAS